MYEKYRMAHFGRCPHVFCQGQPVLPVGLSDLPRNYTVNVFCPRCHGLFFPKSTRQANIDGAYFGTTFPHLYLMTHPVRPSLLLGLHILWRVNHTAANSFVLIILFVRVLSLARTHHVWLLRRITYRQSLRKYINHEYTAFELTKLVCITRIGTRMNDTEIPNYKSSGKTAATTIIKMAISIAIPLLQRGVTSLTIAAVIAGHEVAANEMSHSR